MTLDLLVNLKVVYDEFSLGTSLHVVYRCLESVPKGRPTLNACGGYCSATGRCRIFSCQLLAHIAHSFAAVGQLLLVAGKLVQPFPLKVCHMAEHRQHITREDYLAAANRRWTMGKAAQRLLRPFGRLVTKQSLYR